MALLRVARHLLQLVLLHSLSFTVINAQTFHSCSNVDTVGADIQVNGATGVPNIANVASCQSLCASLSGCVGGTYFAYVSTCYPKSAAMINLPSSSIVSTQGATLFFPSQYSTCPTVPQTIQATASSSTSTTVAPTTAAPTTTTSTTTSTTTTTTPTTTPTTTTTTNRLFPVSIIPTGVRPAADNHDGFGNYDCFGGSRTIHAINTVEYIWNVAHGYTEMYSPNIFQGLHVLATCEAPVDSSAWTLYVNDPYESEFGDNTITARTISGTGTGFVKVNSYFGPYPVACFSVNCSGH